MRAALRHRDFALLWVAGLISLTGDWLLLIALPLYVYALTGSAAVMSTVFIVEFLPGVLLGSVAGVFVDRWDRRGAMVAATLLQAAGLLPLLLVRSAGELWIVYVVSAVESTLALFFAPAEQALLPRLVGEGELVAANALAGLSGNLARLVGVPLGGVVAGLLGLGGAALLDAGSFLLSAALIRLIAAPGARYVGQPLDAGALARSGDDAGGAVVSPSPRTAGASDGTGETPTPQSDSGAAPTAVAAATESAVPGGWTGVWREWVAGLRLVRRERGIAALFLVAAVQAAAQGLFMVLFIVFVERALRGGATEVGLLRGVQAVGGLLGGLVVGALGRRIPSVRLVGLGAILSGLAELAIWNAPALVPAYALSLSALLFALFGLPGAAFMAGTTTLLQEGADAGYRGRVFGAFGTTGALAQLGGMAAAGLLGDRLGVVPVLDGQAALYLIAGLLALTLLR